MFRTRSDEWRMTRWKQPNVAQASADFLDSTDDPDADAHTPLWKDLTVASGLALALWAIAAVIFLG